LDGPDTPSQEESKAGSPDTASATTEPGEAGYRKKEPGEDDGGGKEKASGSIASKRAGALTDRGLLRAVVLLFGLFLAWRFLAEIATIILLLLLGLLLSVALSGPVEALHRRKVPRVWGTVITATGLLVPPGLGGYLLYPALAEQTSQLALTLPGTLSRLGERLEEGLVPGGGVGPYLPDDLGRALLGGALGLFGALGSTLLGCVVVVFASLYLVSNPTSAARWALRLFPPDHREESRRILSEIRVSLLEWLLGKLISMSIIGALSVAALYVIGIPGALVLGIFAGLVAFAPFIGPVFSAIPPLLLALAGDPLDALWVVLAYAVIQQVESNLIMPLVMQRVVSVHPAVIIAAVAVLGGAFGFLGALLALPMTLTFKVLVEELWFPRLEKGRHPGGSARELPEP